jgi:ComF family protein
MAEHRLRTFSRRIIDYFFPPLCIICDTPRMPHDRWLCEGCKKSLRNNHGHRQPCPRCAMNRRLGHCACTHGWEQPFESVYSILDFDKTAQAIMHQVKYRGKRRFAFYLGSLLAEFVPPDIFSAADALIVVPLHRKRLRRRGYNQSFFLAQGLIHGRSGPPILEGVLQRVKNTASQIKLDRAQRLINMKGAFTVVPDQGARIRRKRLLLVDDIVTTGATTAAAAKTLLNSGCASVRVVSIARD